MEGKKLTTPQKRAIFLKALRRLGTITHAAREAGIDRRTANRWRKTNKKFREDVEAILNEQDDIAYALIFEAIQKGDIDNARWLLTRPGRMFNAIKQGQADMDAAQRTQMVRLEELGKYLADEMADPERRQALFEAQAAHEA